ncbi:PAN domain-containing protein [Purpureocillium lavendulum]|uniref:PAN domain-containing protein n=1 Tax=Purpureocillium lavendulum TaxID=1247861 RepID=A0AB34FEP8_9HYPO|nr:PAN domain-containing protein [Purpureocillium lavendulum]
MQAKLLALFAVKAAALAVRSEADTTVLEHGLVIPGNAARLVKARNVCNADNCLRNLRDKRYSVDASAFCSTYIQSTVVNTKYAIATDHQTSTQTPPPVTVTDVEVTDLLNPTATVVVTQYSTIPDPRYNKRGAQPYPTWLSASYPPERVSSACSCFIPSPSPAIQQTVTLTTSTETVVAVETLPPVTQTVDVTSTHTIDVIATETATVGVTCGIKGCVWGNSLLLQSTNAFSTIAQCKALCASNPACQSFQWSQDLHYCNIGSAPATQFWASPSCSNFKVYDLACSI